MMNQRLNKQVIIEVSICHFAYEFEKHDVATYQHSEIHESTFQTIDGKHWQRQQCESDGHIV